MVSLKFDSLVEYLQNAGIEYTLDALLRKYTTFRLGGVTPCLIRCQKPDQVVLVIQELNRADMSFFLMGDGSNLLVSDDGVPNPVIQYSSAEPSIDVDGKLITVSAATSLDSLAQFGVTHGFAGFVNCSGIPGTVGGAVVGNAGAFGWQIGDCLDSARLIGRGGKVRSVSHADCGFEYRHSALKESDDIVLDANFAITRGDAAEFQAERKRILELRRSKHPDLAVDSCAGSFFKNIEPTSSAGRRQAAGWFLEEVGAKTMEAGGAGVYDKHANILIKKREPCRARDVFELSVKMAAAVKEKFDIDLRREVRLVGNFGEAATDGVSG